MLTWYSFSSMLAHLGSSDFSLVFISLRGNFTGVFSDTLRRQHRGWSLLEMPRAQSTVLISNLLLDFLQRFLETSAGGYRENSSNPMISKAYQATNGMSIVVEGGRLYSILVSRHFSLQLTGTLSWTRTSMEEDEYMRPPRLCPLQMP